MFGTHHIVRHLSNVHTLTLNYYFRNDAHLASYSSFEQLRSLRVLEFVGTLLPIQIALEALQRGRVELQRLTISEFNEQIGAAISGINSIEYLEIKEIGDDTQLIQIASMFMDVDEINIRSRRITSNGIRNALLRTSPTVKWTIFVHRWYTDEETAINVTEIEAIEEVVRCRGIRAHISISADAVKCDEVH